MGFLGGYDDDDVMAGYDTEESSPSTAVEQKAAAVVNDLHQPEPELSEVEKRLEYAQYYKLLLNDSLFNDDSDAARKVEGEIRLFIRERLEVLVGLRQEKQHVVAESQFTDEEVLALKMVAKKITQQPGIVAKPEPKAPPSLKKVTPEAAPAPALKKTTPPRRPGRPRKVQPATPAPTPVEPAKDGPVAEGTVRKGRLEGDQQNRVRTYKRVTAPDGSEFDVDVTPQAKPRSAVPLATPGKNETEMIMQNQAQQAIAAFSPAASVVATKVITSDQGE